MPDKGDVSGNYTGVFRLAAPSDANRRRVIKRNRQVVSCLPCRNRKLKCDRQQPCASCVKRHDEEACRFHAGSGGGGGGGGGSVGGGANAAGGSSTSAAGLGQASPVLRRDMQTKLARLEDLVQGFLSQGEPHEAVPRETTSPAETTRPLAAGSSPPEGSAQSAVQSAAQTPAGGGHLRKEGNKVRFVGATNYQAVLECIQDLQGFVKDTESSAPARTATASGQQGQAKASEHQLLATEAPITIQEVMEYLPCRAECDAILTFYFQQTYMVPVCIHTGQFQRAYEKFWHAPHGTSLLWISLLFSFLSTSVFQKASKMLGNGDGSDTLAADVRNKIAGFSSMAYRSLLAGDYLSGKPYSVEALLIFGIHLVLQKRDTEPMCWHTIEIAVRLAQRMGYHRDASYFVSRSSSEHAVSPFEGEMRRRVWAYLEYFDVVYSFQHGVPPIIHGDMVDTQVPTNLRDEEFDEDMVALPQARSTLDFTPILVLIFGARQVKLLRLVVQQALAVKQPSYGDVRLLDGQLRSMHEDVPPSLRYRPVQESGFTDVPDVIMRRMICEILYLKSMCVLHRRYLTFDGNMYEGSRQACCEASLRLLDLQADFDEHSGEGGRLYEKRYMFTNPTGYHDFLMAAMCICLDLVNMSSDSKPEDRERKINALDRARTIWSKTAHRSKEAAHATNILENIHSQIFQAGKRRLSERQQPTDQGERSAASTAAGTGSGSTPTHDNTDTTGSMGNPAATLHQPSWSAVNTSAPSRKALPKGYSMQFNFDWLEDLGRRRAPTLSGALDDIATDGVDWDRIDSLLLGREHTTSSGTDILPIPQTGGGSSLPPSMERKASKEGWPYLHHQVSERSSEASGASTNFRSWARTGITLAGFGPSYSSAAFP